MSSEIVPMAYGDALIIASDAPPSILPMSVGEMHLFSYLGCVLALFKGKAIGEWGYSTRSPLRDFLSAKNSTRRVKACSRAA